MGIVEVIPADIDFSALDTPTGCWRGKIELADKETDHGEIPSGAWVVDGVWDVPERAEDVPSRTISYKTNTGWVEEKYYSDGKLARQSFCYEDGCVNKRLKWAVDGALLLEENLSSPEEIAEEVSKDGQAVVRREYYPSGKVRSEQVVVEMDYYWEGNPQLYFVAVTYDQDGRVMSRSHAKAA